MILSVDIGETRDRVQTFVTERGLTFTILLDEESHAARAYRIRGIPSSFFIDREGVIQAKHTGALDEALIDQYAESLLR